MSYSHVIGFDDGPFEKGTSDPVMVVGAVCAGTRLHGVVSFEITPDGNDAAQSIVTSVRTSKFVEHLQLIMLQGIAFGGFNVVDDISDHQGNMDDLYCACFDLTRIGWSLSHAPTPISP